jgi:hypothetical protein
MDGAHPITVGVRPDDVIPWREGLDEAAWARLPLTVTTVEALGGETILYGRMGDAPDENPPAEGGGEDGRTIILKAPADFEAAPGDRLEAAVNLRKLHLFDRESGESISPRIPAENLCPCTVEEHALSFAGQRFLLPPALCDRPQTTDSALLTLPSEAILLGTGTVRAHVEEIEVFNTDTSPRTLYRLTVGDSTLFALEHALPRFGAGDTVPFDLDFSRLTIEGCGILPLPTENRLNGRFTKEREIDERDGSPTQGRRVYRFYIDVEDHPIAARIYEDIGTYLGYTVAFYSLFYDINHLIILGRVTSGKGGDILMARAQKILDEEYPNLGVKISMPNEKMRRVGQSIAAASLPNLSK